MAGNRSSGQDMPKTVITIESFSQRLAKALPDMITAGVFFWVWLDPTEWRRELVAQGLMIMLLEFILIHSSGFIGPAVFAHEAPAGKRIKWVAGFGLFYTLFVAAWAWQFQSWWPLVFFLWLLGSKLVDILMDRRIPEEMRRRQMGMVGLSVLFYLLSVFATLFLPFPELGLTRHGHYYGVPGSGEWVSHPHIVVSALVLYFCLLALAKLLAWDVALARRQDRAGQDRQKH